jgi:hypothetical protein
MIEVMPSPSDCMAAAGRKCSGQNRDADAAGGVYREQTTDRRGAEQPGYKQVVRDRN